MTLATVGLLHPGAMGAAVGKLLTRGRRTVLWASEGRSAASAGRAAQAGLQDAGTATAAAHLPSGFHEAAAEVFERRGQTAA